MTEFYTLDKTLSSVVLFLNLAPVYQCVGYGQFIDILQLVAKADASRYGGNLNIGEHLKAVAKVEECGLALDRCRYGNDDLLNLAREELVAEKI